MKNTNQKTFYLFIGTQGSGKSSFYKYLKSKINLGFRINQDVIIKENNLNADCVGDLLKSSRILLSQIKSCISNDKSFNYETSVASHTLLKYIKQAKENGFRIEVFFILLDSCKENIQRVEERVSKGGHKVDNDCIIASYNRRFENIRELLKLSDMTLFFDNTYSLEMIAHYTNNKFVYVNQNSKIMKELFSSLTDGQISL